MKKLTKVVALLLAGTLLGENLVFAQDVMSDPLPFPVTRTKTQQLEQAIPSDAPSLIEVQQQASEDIQKLKRQKGLYQFLSIGAGIGFATTVALLISEQNYTAELEQKMAETLANSKELEIANATLQKEKTKILEKSKQDDKLIGRLVSSKKQLEHTIGQSNHRLFQSLETKEKLEASYGRQLAQLRKELQAANTFIENLLYVSDSKMVVEMSKYTAIFDAKVAQTTRLNLRQELYREPWFKELSVAEQQDILAVVRYLYDNPRANLDKESLVKATSPIMQKVMNRSMSKSTKRIVAFYHAFFKKGNLVVMAALILGATAAHASQNQTKSQEIAQRIDNNFDLFLNATAEELQAMEKDPVVYNTCLRNAAELNLLATSDEALQQEVVETLRPILNKQQLQKTLQRTQAVAR